MTGSEPPKVQRRHFTPTVCRFSTPPHHFLTLIRVCVRPDPEHAPHGAHDGSSAAKPGGCVGRTYFGRDRRVLLEMSFPHEEKPRTFSWSNSGAGTFAPLPLSGYRGLGVGAGTKAHLLLAPATPGAGLVQHGILLY